MAIASESEEEHFGRPNRERGNDDISRRSALTLNFSRHIPVPLLTPSPSEEETQAEGQMLFKDFVKTQVQQEGLEYTQISVMPPNTSNSQLRSRHGLPHAGIESDGDYMDSHDETDSDSVRERDESLYDSFPIGYKNPVWAKAGRELRQLADKFAQSEERRLVKEKANQVNIEGITREEFQDLLCELFRDGIVRRERIVTLFFFCTDVMIRALKERIASQVHRLFLWSLNFITERVCRWVQEQGGWGVVLGTYVPKLIFTVCALTVTVAAAFFIWKNW